MKEEISERRGEESYKDYTEINSYKKYCLKFQDKLLSFIP